MTKKSIVFHLLFLLFISVWLATILNVILNDYSTSQALSSSSPFAGYFGLFYWLIAGVSAATSFALGLDKLGILEVLRGKIFSKDGGYEPEIYMALPESQPIKSTATSVGKEHLLTEQNNAAAVIAKVNKLIKQEGARRKNDKMKAFYLFGETEFRKCQHKFGFLGMGLGNKPIPDECFGCPKIIECFKKTKKSKKKRKPELSTTL